MNKDVIRQRIYGHMKRFQELAWPGESTDQIVKRLLDFAAICRDTSDFTDKIGEFFPQFLEDPESVKELPSDTRMWLPGLTSESWLANYEFLMDNEHDSDQSILICLAQMYYYTVDPEQAAYCGYELNFTGLLTGYSLRTHNVEVRQLICTALEDTITTMQPAHLLPVCAAHAIISRVVPGSNPTFWVLEKRQFNTSEKKAMALQYSILEFPFTLWWKFIDAHASLTAGRPQIEKAADDFLQAWAQWCSTP